MNLKLALIGLPVLLSSTAAMAADLAKSAVVASGPGYSLSASGGVVGFMLPTQDTGVEASGNFSVADPTVTALGLQGSLSGAFDLGTTGGARLSLGVDVFGAVASGTDSTVVTFNGPGTVVIPGYTTPAGTIDLTTGSGTATSTINGGAGSLGQTATVILGGHQDALGVKAPGNFSLAVASTSGTNGAAYGAIGSTDGGIFIGTGDLTGLKVTTSETQSIIYGGADLSLAATGDVSDGMSLQGFVGPSYKYLHQSNTTATSVSIPALTNLATPPSSLVMPTYTDTRSEDITSHYLGGLGGLNVTTRVASNMSLTLGGQLGIYDVWSSYSGSETYSVGGGANAPGGSTALPVATTTVTNATSPSGSTNNMAYSAGLNGALTMAMNDKMSVTLGGSAEYLSSVPVLSHATPTLITGGGTTGAANYTAGTSTAGASPILGFASMWDWTGTVSLNGHF